MSREIIIVSLDVTEPRAVRGPGAPHGSDPAARPVPRTPHLLNWSSCANHPRLRSVLLSAALAATLAAPLVQSAQAVTPAAAERATDPAAAFGGSTAHPAGPAGDVAHGSTTTGAPGPEGAPGNETLQPTTDATRPAADPSTPVAQAAPAAADASAACTLASFTALSPAALADFLADRSHTYDGCLRPLLVDWSPELAKVLTPAHVRAVADRITALSPASTAPTTATSRNSGTTCTSRSTSTTATASSTSTTTPPRPRSIAR